MSDMNTVEAKSLSSLTALAADPPIDPGNTYEKHDPLVLYIARVPGSKDVFLTPMKPRDKVVTAADVESCLYYLHVHGPSDGRFLQEDRIEGEMKDLPPLPPPHRSSTAVETPSTLPQWGSTARTTAGAGRALLALPSGLETAIGESRNQTPTVGGLNTALKRKPVSTLGSSLSDQANILSDHNSHAGMYMKRQQDFPSIPPPYPIHDVFPNVENWIPATSRNKHVPYPQDREEVLNNTVRPNKQQQTSSTLVAEDTRIDNTQSNTYSQDETGSALTLIRRDPSLGEQWNVASIDDFVTSDASPSAGKRKSKAAGQPIHIAVPMPGYAKFPSERRNSQSVSVGASTGVESLSDSETSDSARGIFKRELYMEESYFTERISKHKKSTSADSGYLSPNLSPPDPYSRRGSEHSARGSSSKLSVDLQPRLASTAPKKATFRSKGYTFLSPWNGRCEFSAGMGHSLKCKHRMGPTHLTSEASPPSVVSELRFNLPGGGPLATSPATREGDTFPVSRRRLKIFSRSNPSSSSLLSSRQQSEPDASRGSLDLSLGQELAGGGFAGKQAKLGKLIIENEGLKMMDLLVAANMSLWWRAYEKG